MANVTSLQQSSHHGQPWILLCGTVEATDIPQVTQQEERANNASALKPEAYNNKLDGEDDHGGCHFLDPARLDDTGEHTPLTRTWGWQQHLAAMQSAATLVTKDPTMAPIGQRTTCTDAVELMSHSPMATPDKSHRRHASNPPH